MKNTKWWYGFTVCESNIILFGNFIGEFLLFIIILERKDKKRNDQSFRLIKRKERKVYEI